MNASIVGGAGREAKPILIRADAWAGIGAGHVMRCLALAQAWMDRGGKAHFLLGGASGSLEARLRSEGVEASRIRSAPASREDAEESLALARRLGAAAVVTDGYPFTGPYQRILKEGGVRLLVIDDNGECAPYEADLILNQNIHAREGWYRERRPGAALLLGSRFAMLRKEFLAPPAGSGAGSAPRDPSEDPRNILVTMGGGDPDNATLRVIRALQGIAFPGMAVKVVVGMVNPNLASLEAAVADRPDLDFALQREVRDMPGLMGWADIAVSAAGSTVWELMHAGLPSLLVVVAENQREIAARLDLDGMGVNLGWHADLLPQRIAAEIRDLLDSAPARAAMAGKGRDLIDGRGAARVAAALDGEESG